MATNEFKIALLSAGSDPADWTTLDSLLSVAGKLVDPDWSFNPYAKVVVANSGKQRGKGFATAGWHWNYLKDWQREALRAFCPYPAMSATVYIRTLVNETTDGVKTWGNFKAEMYWPAGDEDKQSGTVLSLDIEFHHLVPVPDIEGY
jgi:hypothetical protein